MKIDSKLFEKKKRFLLDAEEPFLIGEFLSQTEAAIPKALVKICYGIEDFLSRYHDGDMFSSSQKVLVLWEFLPEHVEFIESLLDSPTDDILILIKRGSIPKTKAYTRINTEYTIVKLDKASKHGCETWVRDYMRTKSMDYVSNVPSYLVDHIGADLYALHQTIKKLQALTGKVTPEMCDRVMSYIPEANYFDFFDALLRRRAEVALSEFHKIREDSYGQLVHFMIGQIERLYRVAALRQQKYAEDDIAEMIGVPKFILRTKMLPAIASFNRVKLILLLELVNDLEKMLRSTKFSKSLVFESYLLKALKV